MRFLIFPIAILALALASATSGPNDCAIVATEAAARLAPSASWSRILMVRYIGIPSGRVSYHALAVWTPATAQTVCAYDRGGTIELGTASHEANVLGPAYCKAIGAIYSDAHFLK